ncbi:serine protease inhibitor-like [Bicyclus anynana]|uniref:Serine protease inhibitor-like n=1 Tax=Bicyclus anynana TaxID=110368 RepID=A0A6J1MIE7_BICAN|nr:serine protease inhibitor-like [Bicyclus anynana]
MTLSKIILIKLLILSVTTSCSASIEFSSHERNFGIYIMYQIVNRGNNGNLIFAPLSIWSLMAGVSFGATGECRNQISSGLLIFNQDGTFIDDYKNLIESVLNNENKVTLESVNFAFIDASFSIKPEFRSVLMLNFDAVIKSIDFRDTNKAADLANEAIKDSVATFTDVFRPEDFQESSIIVSNAILFKGNWSTPFKKSNTILKIFRDVNDKQIGQVNMMHQRTQVYYSQFDEMGASIMELPYADNDKYCMLLIFPYIGTTIGEVYRKFGIITFHDIFDKLQNDVDVLGFKDINVELPRFRIKTSLVFDEVMKDAGIRHAFDPKLAAFDKIANESIYIGTLEHKAYIEVTEFGTLAYATTPGHENDDISDSQIEAQRPFLFYILEKPTLTIIFGGAYTKHLL